MDKYGRPTIDPRVRSMMSATAKMRSYADDHTDAALLLAQARSLLIDARDENPQDAIITIDSALSRLTFARTILVRWT